MTELKKHGNKLLMGLENVTENGIILHDNKDYSRKIIKDESIKNKKIILVDIDGTLADLTHRLHFITKEKPNWDAFHEECDKDKPIHGVVNIVNNLLLLPQYEIVFCTARPEKVRNKTFFWLKKHIPGIVPNVRLLMRKNGDFRHDAEVKPELLQEAGIELSQIEFVLEDRNSMVKKWREMGLTCLQVAEGDF